MSYFTADVLIDVFPKSHEHYHTEAASERVIVGVHLARRPIESGFEDACRTENGLPTSDGLLAVEWLEARTDWTLKPDCPIPPEKLRQEFYGSFEWACRWLGEDPDKVRREGLPKPSVRAVPHKYSTNTTHRQQTRPARTEVKHTHGWTAGLPAVYQAWEAARVAHEARQAQGTTFEDDTPSRSRGAKRKCTTCGSPTYGRERCVRCERTAHKQRRDNLIAAHRCIEGEASLDAEALRLRRRRCAPCARQFKGRQDTDVVDLQACVVAAGAGEAQESCA